MAVSWNWRELIVLVLIALSGCGGAVDNSGNGAPLQGGKAGGSEASLSIDSLPVATLAGSELEKSLADGLKLTGTLDPQVVTEGYYPNTETFHRWNANLRLQNDSNVAVEIRTRLLLIEMPAEGASYEGYAVFGTESDVVGPESLGLGHNYDLGSVRVNQGGGMTRYTYGGEGRETYGAVPPGKSWSLERGFNQFSWLSSEVRSGVWFVLPDVRVKTSSGIETFGLICYCDKPIAEGKPWTAGKRRLVPLQPERLISMLADPSSNLVTKVLAANWLAEHYPQQCAAPVIAAGKPLKEGQLLASCLTLLAHLRLPGFETEAARLLPDTQVPNGIRALAADYLAAVKHGPGLELLVASTKDEDQAVHIAAIKALGAFGSSRAVDELIAILRDPELPSDHRRAADALAQTKDSRAVGALKEVAAEDQDALEALVAAGLPETFGFFVELAKSAEAQDQQDRVARGLKSSGGEKAIPVLLQMLSRTPVQDDGYGGSVVSMLIELNSPAATGQLAKLASEGNEQAARVLAGSQNESVRAPLTQLAQSTNAAVRRIALRGLVDYWAKQSTDLFAAALGSSDAELVGIAISGVQQGKSPQAAALLVKLLEHEDPSIRQQAAWAIRSADSENLATKLAETLLRSNDPAIVSPLVDALIAAEWKDRTALRKLGAKLQASQNQDEWYQLIRLMQHVADNPMGPKDYDEWFNDVEGWRGKWVEWASKQ